MISFSYVLLRHDELDAIPAFGLFEPLVSVHSDLSAERLGEDENVADDSVVGNDVVIWLADSRRDAADCAPKM